MDYIFRHSGTSLYDRLRPFMGKKRINYYYNYCIENKLQSKMVLFTYEPPVVSGITWNLKNHKNFSKVITWNDALVDNRKYFKYSYVQPDLEQEIKEISFENKKLCTLVAGNKSSRHPLELYSERVRAIEFFERNRPDDFDLYGTGWNKNTIPYVNKFITYSSKKYKSYRGKVQSKLDTLAQYKFCICYENMKSSDSYHGYITEKVFDCFKAGCVPIYLGEDNVTSYLPENIFIDKRKFGSYVDLLDFIEGMGSEEYNAYINRIKSYLNSDLYYPFTVNGFIDNFKRILIDG